MKFYTWANTPDKAYANILMQAKQQLGHKPNSKLTLAKTLIKKEELKYGKST